MTEQLAKKYGVDELLRAERLRALGLTSTDHDWTCVLQERVILPHLHALATVGRRSFGAVPAQVLRAQINALTLLGRDFDTQEYVEARLGTAHVAFLAGVPLGLYLTVQNAIAAAILDRTPPELFHRLAPLVVKLNGFDASLAADVFHGEQAARSQRKITQARAAEKKQRRLARTDSLTGLVNRLSIEQHLEQNVRSARAAGHPLSAAIVDIDRFKDVNDRYGHLVGDEALRQVSSRMTGALRTGDWIGRYGGEEFLVVLDDADLDAAREVAERIRQRVRQNPVNVHGVSIPITVSIGVAVLLSGETASELIARADAAMYRAKHAGRDNVSIKDTLTALRAG